MKNYCFQKCLFLAALCFCALADNAFADKYAADSAAINKLIIEKNAILSGLSRKRGLDQSFSPLQQESNQEGIAGGHSLYKHLYKRLDIPSGEWYTLGAFARQVRQEVGGSSEIRYCWWFEDWDNIPWEDWEPCGGFAEFSDGESLIRQIVPVHGEIAVARAMATSDFTYHIPEAPTEHPDWVIVSATLSASPTNTHVMDSDKFTVNGKKAEADSWIRWNVTEMVQAGCDINFNLASTDPVTTTETLPGGSIMETQNRWITLPVSSMSLTVSFAPKEAKKESNLGAGPDSTTGQGDLVNITNGNMYITGQDLFVPGKGLPVDISRTYNSKSAYNGPFGYGWTYTYNIILAITEDSEGNSEYFTERDEDGTLIDFTDEDSDGVFTAWNHSTIVKNQDGTYTLTRKHGVKLNFNAEGKLTSVIDRNNNQTALTYTNGLLTSITDSSGRVFNLSYTNGKITQITDPANRTITYGYDGNDNLVSVTDPAGNVTSYVYDSEHNLLTLTDPNNHHTYFSYDEEDRCVESKRDEDNQKFSFTYDPENSTTVMTDANNNETIFVYDPEKGVNTSIIDSLGNATVSTWDEINKTSVSDANGNITNFSYDDKGNVLIIADPLDNITTFTYDPAYSLVTSISDPLEHTTSYTYDSKGNLTQVTDASGNATSYTYDSSGNLLTLKDAKNNITSYSYDSHANLIETKDPLNNKTAFSYDILGNVKTMTNAKGDSTSYAYDSLNRLTKITYPDNTSIAYCYDPVGNRLSVTDPNNHITGYFYDAVDRLTQVTDAAANTTVFGYDKMDNRLSVTDANSNTTQYQYDALNRLTESRTPNSGLTQFTYDPVGNRISAKDANGNTIQYSYDQNNRLTTINYPDTTSSTNTVFNYDAAGKRVSMTDSQGITVYSYDELNRLIQVDGPAEAVDTISYSYDSVGNRISMTDQDGGATSYEYDSLNRLVKLTDPNGKKTSYSYDKVSNLTGTVYPNHTEANYAFDRLNRLTKLVNQRVEELPGRGRDQQFRKAEVCRLTPVRNHFNEIISSYNYQYDPAGMRTKVTLANGDYINYTYDSLNQLTSEVKMRRNSRRLSYEYEFDPAGNRTNLIKNIHQKPPFAWEKPLKGKDLETFASSDLKTSTPSFWDLPGLTNFSYSYDAENRLLQVRAIRKESTFIADYAYDQNGNLTNKTEYVESEGRNPPWRNKNGKIETTVYSYDFENRLILITYPDGSTSEYIYDGVGKRIKIVETEIKGKGRHQEIETKITKFLYDGLNVIIERDEDDNTVVSYVRGLSYGGGIGGIISVTRVESRNYKDRFKQHPYRWKPVRSTSYYHYDGIGAVTALTDKLGFVVQAYEYDAYGNLLQSAGGTDNSYLFSTKEYSSKSGLSYFGARYYDPSVGRFITKDPLGMINGPNMYLYLNNNPVNFVDPYGLCKKETPNLAKLLTEWISIADIIPIGWIPLAPPIPQGISAFLDFGSFVMTETVYIGDSNLKGIPFWTATGLNAANLGIGLGGTLFPVTSLAELGLMSLQGKITSDTWNPFPETTNLIKEED